MMNSLLLPQTISLMLRLGMYTPVFHLDIFVGVKTDLKTFTRAVEMYIQYTVDLEMYIQYTVDLEMYIQKTEKTFKK